jgi:probable HAF family extracellular repeat protein
LLGLTVVAVGGSAVAGVPLSTVAVGAEPAASESVVAKVQDLGTAGLSLESIDVSGNLVTADVELSGSSERSHAFIYDLGAATPRWRDLGTLGGAYSSPSATNGKIVVGYADTRSATHAFAYDLDAVTPTMRDLGTLGGAFSEAVDVSGSIVVGSAWTSSNAEHAFLYDLSAPAPTMRDLGTLGGAESYVSAVSGNLVVGGSTTGTGETHAFVYDLAATTPRMQDLGTLGGSYSAASDVAGEIVVGGSSPTGDRENSHAFAYDLAAAAPTMRDLGRVANIETAASQVSGNLVIGNVAFNRTGHSGFVYDLGAADPHMRVIDLGGGSSGANEVDGNVVVGTVARAGDGAVRNFAYDFDQAEPQMSDLGPADEDFGSGPAISGNVMVTSRLAGGRVHGLAWTLSKTTMPALRLDRTETQVQENVGRVLVTVARGGDPAPAVSIPYRTRNEGATAGKDYVATAGTLSFAAGQTSGSFSVPIRNDARNEWDETVMVVLGQPSTGAIRGAPNTAAIEILASDHRPDGWISTRSGTGYVGNNVYNTTGTRQTKTLRVHRGHTRTFYARVYNDGNTSTTDTITLKGSPPRAGSGVHYYLGTRDVTTTMNSASGLQLHLGWHAHRRLVMRIHAKTNAPLGTSLPGKVTATWVGDSTRSDLVKGVVKVIR